MRFAPTDVGFIADPYPDYEELRRSAPVVYDEATDHWLISRYADVDALLRDRRFGRTYLHTATHEEMGRPAPPDWHAPFWDLINAGILDMEPPDHTRVRRLVSKAFTPRFVESLRPRVHAHLRRAARDGGGRGGVRPAAHARGAAARDRDRRRCSASPRPTIISSDPGRRDIVKMYELHPTEPAQHDAVRASLEFSAYLRELAQRRRTSPGDDLISGLVHVIDEGETLTEDELVGTCVLLLNAGHEATVNATLLGWWALFRHPDRLKELRADPTLLPTAIEELLRFQTPLPMFERWVLEPFELHGVEIPKGAELGLLFDSANRDPDVFEEPDDLRLDRRPNPHLTFGAGIHFCLGAPLGRMELQISFGTMLERFPHLELVEEPTVPPELHHPRARGPAGPRTSKRRMEGAR